MNTNIISPLTTNKSERTWGMSVHLVVMIAAMMTSWVAGAAGAVAALAFLLIKPMGSAFVAEHAREALNFNISMFLYAAIGFVLTVLTLGLGLIVFIPLGAGLALMWLACSIIAAIQANDGQVYRYPLSIRFVR